MNWLKREAPSTPPVEQMVMVGEQPVPGYELYRPAPDEAADYQAWLHMGSQVQAQLWRLRFEDREALPRRFDVSRFVGHADNYARYNLFHTARSAMHGLESVEADVRSRRLDDLWRELGNPAGERPDDDELFERFSVFHKTLREEYLREASVVHKAVELDCNLRSQLDLPWSFTRPAPPSTIDWINEAPFELIEKTHALYYESGDKAMTHAYAVALSLYGEANVTQEAVMLSLYMNRREYLKARQIVGLLQQRGEAVDPYWVTRAACAVTVTGTQASDWIKRKQAARHPHFQTIHGKTAELLGLVETVTGTIQESAEQHVTTFREPFDDIRTPLLSVAMARPDEPPYGCIFMAIGQSARETDPPDKPVLGVYGLVVKDSPPQAMASKYLMEHALEIAEEQGFDEMHFTAAERTTYAFLVESRHNIVERILNARGYIMEVGERRADATEHRIVIKRRPQPTGD